jgi:NAD(P)H-flavin reductase/ferredoxin
MTQIKFKNDVFTVSAGNTVLDTLLEHGHEIPNNCRAGACQSCLMQVTKGNVPEQSQKGLKDSYKAKGLFLACSCEPEEDIEIHFADSEQSKIPATVSQISELSADVIELKIKTTEPYEYHAGQYVTLWRDDSLGRCYSLASLPQKSETLNFHIRLIPNGMFSGWVHNDLQIGDTLFVQGPAGDCFYTPGNKEQNLLLVGTSTGLAPLYGIIHDALQQGHTGEIHLFHGGYNITGLYLRDELAQLEKEYTTFKYHPCVFTAETTLPENIIKGDITEIVLQTIPQPAGWKTFLCGNEELVKNLRKKIFLAGCSMNDIYSDPFIYT